MTNHDPHDLATIGCAAVVALGLTSSAALFAALATGRPIIGWGVALLCCLGWGAVVWRARR